VVEVTTIGGGLPRFLGASFSGSVLCSSSLIVHVISSERYKEVANYHCLGRQLASGGFWD
jgi:hypothetical protein